MYRSTPTNETLRTPLGTIRSHVPNILVIFQTYTSNLLVPATPASAGCSGHNKSVFHEAWITGPTNDLTGHGLEWHTLCMCF